MIRGLRRVPRPLALLLAAATFQALAWIVLIPPMQGPDEDSHYSYVEKMVEGRTIPWDPGQPSLRAGTRGPLSTQTHEALVDSGLLPLVANIQARPLWTKADEAVEQAHQRRLAHVRRFPNNFNTAEANPPVYYLYAAVPYVVAGGGSLFDRIELMRLANIPLLLAIVIFTWLLCGELLPGALWPRFLAAAAAASVPQLLNVTATVSPDVLLAAEWSAALYVMTLLVRRGATRSRSAALIALCIIAPLTHPRALPMLLPAVLALGWALYGKRAPRRFAYAATGAGAAYIVVAIVLAARGAGNARQFASYVWQFYLPHLPSMKPPIGPHSYDFGEAYVDRFFGSFASGEVVLPHTLDRILFWATIAGLAALLVSLIARRARVKAQWPAVVVLGAAVPALIIGLHVGAYRGMLATPGDPVFTGRYLLPLLPLFGTAIALVATTLPRRAGRLLAAVVLAAGFGLELVSLGHILERFYA